MLSLQLRCWIFIDNINGGLGLIMKVEYRENTTCFLCGSNEYDIIWSGGGEGRR